MNRTEPLRGITSAGQPDAAAFEALAAEGYTAVIDLRGATEDAGLDEAEVVESLGMRYVNLPIMGPEDINFENAKALDEILAGIDAPVLVHCSSGNRVGGLLALREGLRGASVADAIAVGLAGGMSARLQSRVEQLLEQR